MSFHTIPNSGPFNDPVLDEGRMHALMAVDAAEVKLPGELVAYLVILEQRHLEMIRERKATFLRDSWQVRLANDEGNE